MRLILEMVDVYIYICAVNHTKMIRFSNRVKYGIQFLLFLTIDDEDYTGIQRAALSCQISQKFLEAIAVDLRKGGLLDVKRGAGGGYRLARAPGEISIADVLTGLEMVEQTNKVNSSELMTGVVNASLEDALSQCWKVLEHTTIENIRKRYADAADKLMYYI
jgi:Rrf2 family protein